MGNTEVWVGTGLGKGVPVSVDIAEENVASDIVPVGLGVGGSSDGITFGFSVYSPSTSSCQYVLFERKIGR